MIYPAITAFYAAILALIFAALSAWVIAGRVGKGILHGAGDDDDLLRRMRSHGNFAEYVPFIVVLVGLFEAAGGAKGTVRILLILLCVVRLMHPVGMMAPVNSAQQYACRGLGIIVTLGIMIVSAGLLLWQVGHA